MIRPLSPEPAPVTHLPTPEKTPVSPTSKGKEAPSKSGCWVAQYLYPGPDGETRLVVRKIRAKDRESAEAVALKGAPAEEFALTLVPESDDQFLGQVRHRALAAKARRS